MAACTFDGAHVRAIRSARAGSRRHSRQLSGVRLNLIQNLLGLRGSLTVGNQFNAFHC